MKTKAGLLEIYLSLSGGSIENVVITGDFFSSPENANRIENALRWISAREEMRRYMMGRLRRDKERR